MKFYCTQENLNYGLNVVSHLTGKNITLPILNNVFIEVENGQIELKATNLEIGIRCPIRGKIEEEGKITLPAKLFHDYINLLPNEKISFEQIDTKILLRSGSHETTIQGMSSEEYPLLPTLEFTTLFSIPSHHFKTMIQETIFATASDETRPEISGVLFRIEDQLLRCVATDSYRLVEKTVSLDSKVIPREVILPTRTLQELLRILNIIETDSVTMDFTENQAIFRIKDVELISRIIEGKFPDYQQIIPKEFKTRVVAKTEELIRAIKTASLFSRGGIHDIHFKILTSQGILILSAMNVQVGEHLSRMNVHTEGEENNAVFNYRYLLDGLQNIHTEEVAIDFVNNLNPGILRPHGQKDYLYIVMPIKQ